MKRILTHQKRGFPVPVLYGLFGVVIAGALAPAWGNPLPPAAVFTHVEPHVPDFCTTTPITTCEQIVQTTGAAGLLDFDLFYQPMLPDPTPLEAFDLTVEWPAQWTLGAVDFCCGTGTVVQNGNQAQLVIQVDPPYTMGDFFPIARVTVDVSGAGQLAIPEGRFTWVGGSPEYLAAIAAWAAMGCRTCVYPCDLSDSCMPYTDADRIELQATVGGTALGGFHGGASGMSPLCDVVFGTGADWLELEVTPAPTGGYDVTLVADATGLVPGTHETWVNAMTPSCQGCVQVILTVLPCSPTQDSSWGEIKGIFR